MNIEYIEPTRESRRNLLVLYISCILFGVAFSYWLLPAYVAHMNSLPKCDQAALARATLIGIFSTPALIALWAIPRAIRMLKFNQSPLPGAWVLRRTPIRRGRSVRIQAICLLLISVLAFTFPIISIQFTQLNPFADAPKSCT